MPLRFDSARRRGGLLRPVRALLIYQGFLFTMTGGHAADVGELQAILANPARECHPDYRPYAYLEYRECDAVSEPALGAKCANEVARKNSIIGKWNSFVRSCGFSESQTGSLPPTPAKKSAASTISEPTTGPDSEEVVALIQRARKLAGSGDIAAARLVLRRAVEAHSAQAALALGGMYDPAVLDQLHIHGVTPDVAEARRWYEKAREYGSSEAPSRLQALAGHAP
jgi:TPR repeat protein